MSYRIHLGITKKKVLKEYLGKEKEEDDYFDLQPWDIELHDRLDLDQFRKIKEYEDDEYPPCRLSKLDVQKILDYYKKLIHDDFLRKDKDYFSLQKNVVWYFKELMDSKTNINESGLFLLDYFYLVRLYERIKCDECFIITHG